MPNKLKCKQVSLLHNTVQISSFYKKIKSIIQIFFKSTSHFLMQQKKVYSQIQAETSLCLNSDKGSLQRFILYLRNQKQEFLYKKYFTQIQLFVDYFQLILGFSLDLLSYERNFTYKVFGISVDQQCYEIHIVIISQRYNIYRKVLIIQMDRVIKLLFNKWNKTTKSSQTKSSIWFDYKQFINQKISNHYKIYSLKQLRTNKNMNKQSQLNSLFLSRFLESLVTIDQDQFDQNNMVQQLSVEKGITSKANNSQIQIVSHFENLRFFNSSKNWDLGQKFYSVLTNSINYYSICSFIDIKSNLRLNSISRVMKKYFFKSEITFFKRLYEFQFGVTGFQENQLNWKKSLNKKREQKRAEQKKSLKSKYIQVSFLRLK